LGVLSHVEISYFEDSIGEKYSYFRPGSEIYKGYNYLSTTDSEGDRYNYEEYIYVLNETIVETSRNLLTAGQ